jgi:biopolymer transport protein ExbD
MSMLDVGANLTDTERALNLDMTPMIDVVFNLLIFFLLTLAFTRPIFEVDLPGAAHSHIDTEPKQPIIVRLTQDGQVFVEEASVPLEHLQRQIAHALAQDPQRPVVLQADKHSPFGRFIGVMDAAKGAGTDRLIIETTRTAGEDHDAP